MEKAELISLGDFPNKKNKYLRAYKILEDFFVEETRVSDILSS